MRDRQSTRALYLTLAAALVSIPAVAQAEQAEQAQPRPSGEPLATSAAGQYKVDVQAPKKVAVGKTSKVTVKVLPTQPWHMNLDFPSSLSIDSAGGLELAKTKLKKADAKKIDESGLVFELEVKAPSAGKKKASGTLRFAVCSEDSCVPKREKIEIEISAG